MDSGRCQAKFLTSRGKIYVVAILPLLEHKWLKGHLTSTIQKDTTC